MEMPHDWHFRSKEPETLVIVGVLNSMSEGEPVDGCAPHDAKYEPLLKEPPKFVYSIPASEPAVVGSQ